MKIGLLMVHPGLRDALSELIDLLTNPSKKNVFQRFLLVFCCIGISGISAGCQLSARPSWVRVQYQNTLGDADKLSAVGRGTNLEQAEKNARLRVQDSLHQRLSTQLRKHNSSMAKKKMFWVLDDSQKALRRIVGEPIGLRTQSVWSSSNGKEHAALVSIDLREAAQAVVNQISEYETQSRARLKLNHKLDQEQPYTAILNLLGALSNRWQAEEQRIYLECLDSADVPGSSGPSLQALYDDTKALISQLQLYPAKGHGQAVRADAKNVVLVLGVDRLTKSKRIPAGSTPVRFDLPKPVPKTYRSRSNAIGMASTQLDQILPFAGQNLQVVATIDAHAVFSQAGLDATDRRFARLLRVLQTPQAVFRLNVNQNKALRVALVIAETRLGEFRAQSRLVEHLGQLLSQAGYNVISLDELDVKIPSNPTPTRMARQFSKEADILVFGAVEAKVVKNVASLVFVNAQAHLMAVRTKQYRLLFEIKPSLRSPGHNAQSAAMRALASLSTKVMDFISKAISK